VRLGHRSDRRPPRRGLWLVTDLPTLASPAEEAVATEWRKGDAVRQGAVFAGHNQNGSKHWSTQCTLQRLTRLAEAG
jgi:hypothetical protein